MNRRKFITAVAAGVAAAIAGPEKLFVFGKNTVEIIGSKSAGAVWNYKAEYFSTILNNPLIRIGPLFKEQGND